MSSLNDLMSTSCVFEMAALVSSVVGNEVCEGHYSVVGHSLGGAAVQYIVRDFHRHPFRNPRLKADVLSHYFERPPTDGWKTFHILNAELRGIDRTFVSADENTG